MKKSLTRAQLTDILTRALVAAGEPVQAIEFIDAEMDIDIDIDIAFDAQPPLVARPSTPVATVPCPGTKKISIRVPNAIIRIFKDEAKLKGIPYQTLMIRSLKESSKGW